MADRAKLRLRLYVVSAAPNSRTALMNLRAMLADLPADDYSLEVVDCVLEPHRVLADGVLVTPTLLKLAPGPEQTIIGTLDDSASVLAALGLSVAGA